MTGPRIKQPTLARLTPRERQIAKLVATGMSDRAAATKLNMSFRTVKLHLHHIYGKLSLPNRTALGWFISRGLTP